MRPGGAAAAAKEALRAAKEHLRSVKAQRWPQPQRAITAARQARDEITGYIIGAVADVEVLGPSVLAIFNSSGGAWADIIIATGLSLVMLIITIVGIGITARTQVGMAPSNTPS